MAWLWRAIEAIQPTVTLVDPINLPSWRTNARWHWKITCIFSFQGNSYDILSFLISYDSWSTNRLANRLRNGEQTISFDKDDDDTLDFVTSSSNLRSYAYGIPCKTRWEVKGLCPCQHGGVSWIFGQKWQEISFLLLQPRMPLYLVSSYCKPYSSSKRLTKSCVTYTSNSNLPSLLVRSGWVLQIQSVVSVETRMQFSYVIRHERYWEMSSLASLVMTLEKLVYTKTSAYWVIQTGKITSTALWKAWMSQGASFSVSSMRMAIGQPFPWHSASFRESFIFVYPRHSLKPSWLGPIIRLTHPLTFCHHHFLN